MGFDVHGEHIVYSGQDALKITLGKVFKLFLCPCEVDKGYFGVKFKETHFKKWPLPEYKICKVTADNIHQIL